MSAGTPPLASPALEPEAADEGQAVVDAEHLHGKLHDQPNDQLRTIALGSDWFMAALRAARGLGLNNWCIGAGAVRNLVWDHLHGYMHPSALSDVDLAYFDAEEPEGHEARHQQQLTRCHPELPWEVTNQVHVHRWFEQHFGHPVAPLESLEQAIASWPEYATAVGLRLEADDSLSVIAPLGLEDLFAMRIRRNPARVSLQTYQQRVVSKRYTERWSRVQVHLE